MHIVLFAPIGLIPLPFRHNAPRTALPKSRRSLLWHADLRLHALHTRRLSRVLDLYYV
jgi:hypothetical protein